MDHFLQIVSNTLWAAVALGLLIFLHELGHFLVARKIGVGVEVFSLGFGKRLFGVERGGTDYRVSLMPLGGYVKMMGEEPGEESPEGSPMHFQSRRRWERALILLAGPGSNLVLAFVFVSAAYLLGIPQPAYLREPPRIGYVEPDSAAQEAGLRPGDLVLTLGGKAMANWEVFQTEVALNPNRKMPITVERGGERLPLTLPVGETDRERMGYAGVSPVWPFEAEEVKEESAAEEAGILPGDRLVSLDGEPILYAPRGLEILASRRPGGRVETLWTRQGREMPLTMTLGDCEGSGCMGVMMNPFLETRRYPLGDVPAASMEWMGRNTAVLFSTLGRLFTFRLSIRAMSGPLEIAKFSGRFARAGFSNFLLFLAFLSLNLGILNLLPIPVLDGGHLFFLAVEGMRRRDLSMALKERLLQAGFAALITLMAVVLFFDFLKNVVL
jgi:regulator of sigma E protease